MRDRPADDHEHAERGEETEEQPEDDFDAHAITRP
jgi:hypothetical protein